MASKPAVAIPPLAREAPKLPVDAVRVQLNLIHHGPDPSIHSAPPAEFDTPIALVSPSLCSVSSALQMVLTSSVNGWWIKYKSTYSVPIARSWSRSPFPGFAALLSSTLVVMNRSLRGTSTRDSASPISEAVLYLSEQSRCRYPAFNALTMAETRASLIGSVGDLFQTVPVPKPMAGMEMPEERAIGGMDSAAGVVLYVGGRGARLVAMIKERSRLIGSVRNLFQTVSVPKSTAGVETPEEREIGEREAMACVV